MALHTFILCKFVTEKYRTFCEILNNKKNRKIGMNKILGTLIVFIAITGVSCSDDDEPQIPANAIQLNMMIGDSESTIGGSDVYINTSVNFTTYNCGIADLGKKGSLNQNPNLSQIAQQVAVTPGNFYQITLAGDIRTIAGARALPIKSNYYNVYVDSWIYDKDNDISGAKVKYAECFPNVYTDILPEWGTTFPVYLKSWDSSVYGEYATYTFDKNVKIDSGYTVYASEEGNTDLRDNIQVTIQNNEIKFSNSSYTPYGKAVVIVNIRYESLYTQVQFLVTSSRI